MVEYEAAWPRTRPSLKKTTMPWLAWCAPTLHMSLFRLPFYSSSSINTSPSLPLQLIPTTSSSIYSFPFSFSTFFPSSSFIILFVNRPFFSKWLSRKQQNIAVLVLLKRQPWNKSSRSVRVLGGGTVTIMTMTVASLMMSQKAILWYMLEKTGADTSFP